MKDNRPPNRMIKSKRMSCAGHVARIGQKEHMYDSGGKFIRKEV
jgi:hypothetical protein